MENIIFNNDNIDLLCCPVCSNDIVVNADKSFLQCTSTTCKKSFPIFNGIPCVLNEENSIFSNADFAAQKDTFFKLSENKIKKSVFLL